MKCRILHETKGHMRVHVMTNAMSMEQADIIEAYFSEKEGIADVKAYDRTGDMIITYSTSRNEVIRLLSGFSFDMPELQEIEINGESRELSREYEEKLVKSVVVHYAKKMYLPMGIRAAISFVKSFKYIFEGLKSLKKGRIDVSVLDATAVTVSVLRQDYSTASSVMFMLHIGEILEEWTHKKSVNNLARMMSLNVEKVWVIAENDREVLINVNKVHVGDRIIVRKGNMIPLDGKVIDGEAAVNQASLTGESMPVMKSAGAYAYAGTVVEEGQCVIQVEKSTGKGRYDRIVKMIEESEKLKSATENRAMSLADHLVPYTLVGSGLAYLLTRNIQKALSVLMVDFSCALKLAMPIAVLSAMKEGGKYQITIKGGKFLENIAEADTIVFDKTGTLTYSQPTVKQIVTFGENDEQEMLRLSACLEEHYPHSIANAVVEEARKRNLSHEEEHSTVEYVVAHGIASSVNGSKVIIGSYHFVFEDENTQIPEGEEYKLKEIPRQYSRLFLAIDNKLAAVICIEDPLRAEAAEVINKLHKLGMDKIVMLTGDNRKTAKAIAAEAGVDEFYAEVLPEDKADFIKSEHEAHRKVIMIGDGVNDSLALSEADVGIAIHKGAAIAREIADITISADDLNELVVLKQLSNRLSQRVKQNYKIIMSFNGALIVFGVLGIIAPTTSALLHNTSTILLGLHSMTDLLD